MKIQIGKRYVTRSGLVTGKIIERSEHELDYPFECMIDGYNCTFTSDGRYFNGGGESYRDLLKEYKPSFLNRYISNPNRIWSIFFIALCMMIGGAINSLMYEYERREWREAKQAEWQERMGAVEHTQRQADSVLNEAREVAREIKNK